MFIISCSRLRRFFLLVKVEFLFLCCKDTAIMAKEKGIFPK